MNIIRAHKLLAGAFAVLIALSATNAAANVTLTHVHGLAYGGDGTRIYVPSHHGLAVYEDGKWRKAAGPQHDFMGFVATEDRFYSSGHPAPGSGLSNPFGLIRSSDGGKTWAQLGLQGETDFHLLAASHGTNAIHVFNPAPNSRMPSPGLYRTTNDGLAWQRSRAEGLTGKPIALASHPQDPARMAVASSTGVHLSKDSGDSFRQIASAEALAVFFDLDGKHLWHSSFVSSSALTRTELASGLSTAIALPPLGKDAVSYVAQNAKKHNEYAIATFKRNVFVSQDSGKTWTQIAKEGEGLDR